MSALFHFDSTLIGSSSEMGTSQGTLTVKSAAYDSALGGRDMDWAVAQHAADEFKAKTGKVCQG